MRPVLMAPILGAIATHAELNVISGQTKRKIARPLWSGHANVFRRYHELYDFCVEGIHHSARGGSRCAPAVVSRSTILWVGLASRVDGHGVRAVAGEPFGVVCRVWNVAKLR
jgi:hypothetical protein